MKELTQDMFFKVGFFCFGVMFIFGIVVLIQTWSVSLFFSKISSIASLIFNGAICWLFYGMSFKKKDNKDNEMQQMEEQWKNQSQ
jgi:hypothetical protein